MEIRENVVIRAPLEVTWPLLQDVSLIAECLPGAQLEEGVDEEGRRRGSLTVQFGPSRVTFQGSARFQVADDAHRVDLEGRGSDSRGRNRASVQLAVVASELPGDSTALEISGGIDVVGPLESFAATGGKHLAKELLATFADNVAMRLETADTSSAGRETDDRAGVGHRSDALSGGRLMWGAFRSWLRSLRSRFRR